MSSVFLILAWNVSSNLISSSHISHCTSCRSSFCICIQPPSHPELLTVLSGPCYSCSCVSVLGPCLGSAYSSIFLTTLLRKLLPIFTAGIKRFLLPEIFTHYPSWNDFFFLLCGLIVLFSIFLMFQSQFDLKCICEKMYLSLLVNSKVLKSGLHAFLISF